MKIDAVELADMEIQKDLESFAQAQLTAKRVQAEGKLEVDKANVKKQASLQEEIAKATSEAEASAAAKKIELEMAEKFAESQAAVMRREAEGLAAKKEIEAE